VPSGFGASPGRLDPLALCDALIRRVSRSRGESAWLQSALRAERCAAGVVESLVADEDELFEPRAIRELAEALPDGARTVCPCATSMPFSRFQIGCYGCSRIAVPTVSTA